jgi:hypothetical protein
VWVVFIGGAASLFILTVLVENNGAWFPAISRANQAMAKTKKQVEQVGAGFRPGVYTVLAWKFPAKTQCC